MMIEEGFFGFQVLEDFEALLYFGDCFDVLRDMPDACVDSIVTDPPYGISFMGKHWDHGVPSAEVWAECLRVLKPGGHLLSFAGTRTQHRMACNIEDAGFEIRDMIAWVYGSGFPKGTDIGKQIDKAAGAERQVTEGTLRRGRTGIKSQPNGGSVFSDDNYQWPDSYSKTAPATDDAKKWEGWRSALKPALEPITVARKPFKGPLFRNVQEHGTGAFNADGCRIPTEDNLNGGAYSGGNKRMEDATSYATGVNAGVFVQPAGRYPANLIHDGGAEVLDLFPDSNGQQGAVTGKEPSSKINAVYGDFNGRPASVPRGDKGSAARFFYCAKASAADRGEGNKHPTVKPTDLMRHLCRLVTPPGGIVLDPFMGSGSTGKAAGLEGFRFIGVEKDSDSYQTAMSRISGVERG